MKKSSEKEKLYSAPAVDKMLDMIEFLSEHRGNYGITELSRRLNISTNSVFRILKCLTKRGYVEFDSTANVYQLGTKFFSLGMRLYSRFDLRIRARKHLETLCHETGETCQIQIPDGDKMLVLDSVNPPVDFFIHIVPGSRVYYHPNAFGKSVLAFVSEDKVKKFLPHEKLPSLTSNTITVRKKLVDEFKKIREKQIAYDMEEYSLGIFCIGSPVFDVEGNVVAGVGMTGMYSRFDKKLQSKYENCVLKCTKYF